MRTLTKHKTAIFSFIARSHPCFTPNPINRNSLHPEKQKVNPVFSDRHTVTLSSFYPTVSTPLAYTTQCSWPCTWIIRNQFGRRNLPAYERAKLALRLEPLVAARAKENQGTRTDIKQKSAESLKPVETRREIAAAANVSHDTIAKVKVIEARATPEVKAALARQDMSINQAYTGIVRVEKEERREARRDENRAKVAEATTARLCKLNAGRSITCGNG